LGNARAGEFWQLRQADADIPGTAFCKASTATVAIGVGDSRFDVHEARTGHDDLFQSNRLRRLPLRLSVGKPSPRPAISDQAIRLRPDRGRE